MRNIVATYAWGIGGKTNNKAEWLSLYLGLELVKKENIRKIIVFGDSKKDHSENEERIQIRCNQLQNIV